MIFGPIFAAAALMLVVFLSPLWSGLNYVNPTVQRNAASSLSPQVLKGQLIKQRALENHYVPFFLDRQSGRGSIRFIHLCWQISIKDPTAHFLSVPGGVNH